MIVTPSKNTRTLSLNELVLRAQARDDAAFGELVRRYRERIFALALHLSGNQSDADDITQEAFLSAYRAIDQFAGRSAFFTWLYRIAVNRALNARRTRSRRGETPLDDPRIRLALEADAFNDPGKATELRQTYSRLLWALDRLPPEMRTTVVLVTLQGMNHEEAAVIQSCSSGTISWRIHKARKRLRTALLCGRRPLFSLPRPDGGNKQGASKHLSPELSALLEEWDIPALSPC